MQADEFSLPQLQNWMQDMLIRHAPVASNTELLNINTVVNASKQLNAIGHLNIYRQSYIARLRSCMQSQFGALAYALGPELFESFADQYLDAYPSNSYTLNTLGEKFSEFLEKTRPDTDATHKESWPDFMIELAKFEYKLSVIFDEQAIENNTTIPDDTSEKLLHLTPVFYLFQHSFPVCKYYLDHSQDKNPELPFPEKTFCVVIRRNYKLGLFTIKEAQYLFLKCMQQGNSVERAKANFIEQYGFTVQELDNVWQEWKKYFISSGFFIVGLHQ
jgi:hypothetical protein